VKFLLKTQKAAEPGREALAAFGFGKAARVVWLPKSPSRSARAQALRLTRTFSKSETRRFSRLRFLLFFVQHLTDEN
jgi:hypothetical protein